MRKLINILLIALAYLSVQGCSVDLLKEMTGYQSWLEEREAKKNRVPETKARFHINDTEYYREDIHNWTKSWITGFNIYNEAGGQCGIDAYIRSVNADNTKGDDQSSIYIHFPNSLLYEGSVIKNRGWFGFGAGRVSSNHIHYGYDEDYISNAHLCHGDYFELSIAKFDGLEVGDSIRIHFKFKFSEIDWQYIDHIATDCGVLGTWVCNDGVFKEVIKQSTVQ